MSKRILEFIDYLGISTAEFERNCGLSNGSVSKKDFIGFHISCLFKYLLNYRLLTQ